jgi:hypothetical protein
MATMQLRIDDKLAKELEKVADAEKRSIPKQAEIFISESIETWKAMRKKTDRVEAAPR